MNFYLLKIKKSKENYRLKKYKINKKKIFRKNTS